MRVDRRGLKDGRGTNMASSADAKPSAPELAAAPAQARRFLAAQRK
jgi:hypothetical protein